MAKKKKSSGSTRMAEKGLRGVQFFCEPATLKAIDEGALQAGMKRAAFLRAAAIYVEALLANPSNDSFTLVHQLRRMTDADASRPRSPPPPPVVADQIG